MTDDVHHHHIDLLLEIAASADRVRHPDLPLTAFVAPQHLPDYDADEPDDEAVEASVPRDELRRARMRRGVLLVAAHRIVDHCAADLSRLRFDAHGLPDADTAEDSFVYGFFPPRYRHVYDERFFRSVLTTAVKVSYDLADPSGGPAACTAEEIIRDTVLDIAGDLCRGAGLGRLPKGLDEVLLEDTDFARLFDSEADERLGVAPDPAFDADTVRGWFESFRPETVAHPYGETRSVTPSVRDMWSRRPEAQLGAADPGDNDIDVDAPEPLAQCGPVTEVVARERASADRTTTDLWVPDDSDLEASFAALSVAATRTTQGSGWLTWQIRDDADAVRTDPVVCLTPHRHFPIQPDEPWVDTEIAPHARRLAIPLRAIVSYRPDDAVRRKWMPVPDGPPPPMPMPPV